MANVSRKICDVMATLHVKMNQTKTIVNALPACFAVRGEDASWEQLCAMEKTIALTEMTKIIAVSRLFVNNVSGLLVKVKFSYSTENYTKLARTPFAVIRDLTHLRRRRRRRRLVKMCFYFTLEFLIC